MVIDETFDPAQPENQQALYGFCMVMNNDERFFDVKCPMLDFVGWIQQEALKNGAEAYHFPVDYSDFHNKWAEYAAKGLFRVNGHQIGFINGKVVFYNVGAMYKGFRNMNSTEAMNFYNEVESFVDEFNSQVGPGINKMWQISYDNWCWLILRRSFIKYAF